MGGHGQQTGARMDPSRLVTTWLSTKWNRKKMLDNQRLNYSHCSKLLFKVLRSRRGKSCANISCPGPGRRTGSPCQLHLALPEWGYATGIAEPLRNRHRGFCPVLGHMSCGSSPPLHSRGPGHQSHLCLQLLPSSKLGSAGTQVWALFAGGLGRL